ncbi:MAG: hypothetical protein DMF62_10825 [Acidobacteria bacterium]|nr:MAG: hypothetical protein DMF62_10825 [Acidobacteriota bacterium]
MEISGNVKPLADNDLAKQYAFLFWMKAKEKFDTLTHEVEGKIVSRLVSYNSNEISIDFVDGTALYIDSDHDELEIVLGETQQE